MEDNTPTNSGRSVRKAGFVGGVLGSVGLAVSILMLSSSAGATEPQLQADTEPVLAEDISEIGAEFAEEDFAAADACWAEMEATFNLDGEFEEDSVDWAAVDAAAEECNSLLPEELQAALAIDEAEWEAYDECVNATLEAQGFDIESDLAGFEIEIDDSFDGELTELGPAVSIMGGDDISFAEFGEGDGTITVTKSGDDIDFTVEGDVEVETLDWDEAVEIELADIEELDAELFEDAVAIDEEFEQAISACDDLLPEGVTLDGGLVMATEGEVVEALEG